MNAGLPAAPTQDRTLRLGVIGCGWYGGVDMRAAYRAGGVEFVALCDIDSRHLDDVSAAVAQRQGAKPRTCKRYEDLLAVPDLDAVIIATPPHWHALPFIAACERGLAIYAEKPLAYDVREGQAMVAAWKHTGNTVQVGFQRRQSDAILAAREHIRAGHAGRILHVDVNVHHAAQPLDNTPQPPPSTLDWELWCGPAPRLPYSPNVGHRAWRLEQAIGNGHLVDWGIHYIDAARYVLGLGMPRAVIAKGGVYEHRGRINTPDSLTVEFGFDECPVVWRHCLWDSAEHDPEFLRGITFHGERETIFATDQRWIVMPGAGDAPRRTIESAPPVDLGLRHMRDFLAAVRTGRAPSCTPEEAWRSTAIVQLAMISHSTGRAIRWDEDAACIADDPAANRMLMRDYRAPYRHPAA